MIIEMVGAPGAGKTTMVVGAEEGCRARGLTPFTVERAARPFAARTLLGRAVCALVPDRYERGALWVVYRLVSGWQTLRVTLKHPALARYLFASQRGRPAAADARGRRVIYWYLRTMGSYGFLKSMAGRDEAIVIDEGFVHRAVQLHASPVETPTGAQLAAYLAVVPRPDLVIHVGASPEVCRRRVSERGVWARLGHLSPSEIERFVQHAHETVTLVRAELRSQGWPVVDVDNDHEDPRDAISSLNQAVAQTLDRQPAAR